MKKGGARRPRAEATAVTAAVVPAATPRLCVASAGTAVAAKGAAVPCTAVVVVVVVVVGVGGVVVVAAATGIPLAVAVCAGGAVTR